MEGGGEHQDRTLFTTAEAAERLGLAHTTVQDAINRGALEVVRIHPRLNMVTLDAIEKYRRERLGKRGGYRGRRRQLTALPVANGTSIDQVEDKQ